ncbi:hypothetical protein BDV93DRAFT_29100 [Ceratobasidium sp. AG-I]|nr:hypothetical protein BDV93DRAFT_29100 [Ceratobasidium sp. AG-I]
MSRKTRSHSQAFGDPSAGVPQNTDTAISPRPGTATGLPRVQPTPVIRRTYGKRRYISGREEPSALESNQMGALAKRTKISASPSKADTHPFPRAQIPLKNLPTNNPKRQLESSPTLIPPPSRFPSLVKPAREGMQDQNALDSPFLEARKPLSRSPGLGLIRRPSSTSSAVKPKPYTRSRHLSLNRSNSNIKKRANKETSAEALRRKTSEATTVLNATFTEHSWLAPPPPRMPKVKDKLRHNTDPSGADFSFNPPAESTLANVRLSTRTAHTEPSLDPYLAPGSATPKVRRLSLRDELVAARLEETKGRRKRHDSILSTDSEDSDTILSPNGLTPKPRFIAPTRQDQETTPRNTPSLMPQLCQPRARSTSISIRPLSVDLAPVVKPLVPPSRSRLDKDDEMIAEGPLRYDSVVRDLADACASMGRVMF